MGSHTWKTPDEAYHGSKWGYVVVAVVIMIVLSLLGAIFYLVGEGLRGMAVDTATLFTYSGIGGVTLLALLAVAVLLVKVGVIAASSLTGFISHVIGFFVSVWKLVWAMFSNIYVLIVAVVLTVVLISALFLAVYSEFPVSFSNPIVIGILVVLLIIFFPFAIFLVDLFSLEHE